MKGREESMSRQGKEDVGTISPAGALLLVLVCLLWGANMPSIKISNEGIPPCLAAGMRSAVAAALLYAYARARGEQVFLSREDLRHGVTIGVLFGLDFLFLYWGLTFTNASRAVIFLYTHPFWTALGAHLLIAHDRLTLSKGGGLLLAFAGLFLVFGSRPATLGALFWLGDLMEVAAAVSWAATTIYIKKVLEVRTITHIQTLFAQLLFSFPVLLIASMLIERGVVISLSGPVLAAFAYQSLVVAFFSYLLWFWMIHRFAVSGLATFTFLTPLFGVIASGLVLGEPLPWMLWAGLILVAAGIFLVNRPKTAPGHGQPTSALGPRRAHSGEG